MRKNRGFKEIALRPINGARDTQFAGKVELRGGDLAPMAGEGVDALACQRVPYLLKNG